MQIKRSELHLNKFSSVFRSRRRSSESSNDGRDDSMLAIGRTASISELIDLTARKKAEVDRLAELERERMQLL
jgi:hypothetical protein